MKVNNKPSILIIDKEQFGYLTDVYKWCEYLKNDYKITVVSSKINYRKTIGLDGIDVDYVKFHHNHRIINAIKLLAVSLYQCLMAQGKIIVIYFPTCSILKKFLPFKKMQVDVRTLAVFEDSDKRKSYDELLKKECRKFDMVSAISKGVANTMNIKDIRIIPLGSDVISQKEKKYDDGINLIYVGTFSNRKLEDTILGLNLFIKSHPQEKVRYNIIGRGANGEEERMKEIVIELGLEDVVKFFGFLPHSEVATYMDRSNIGVCYVPVVDYYQHQPPTKTFEYILSGIYCIATNTAANKELIIPENGCLIDSTPEGFKLGIEKFLEVRERLSDNSIRASLSDYSWNNIVSRYIKPLL